ncbi:MAG: prepilin peptidase [Candidatus Acidiferrales bacterium]
MIVAFVFFFGLIIGSFLNVCILRIPGGKSIVTPASACPQCKAPIKPYDNIPVLSWLLLRGKCRACKVPISPLYPIVELLTALLFLACYRSFGATFAAFKWALFSALMVVLVFTDLRERLLPDIVNYFGFFAGLALSFFVRSSDGTSLWLANRMFAYPPPAPVLSFVDALLGAALGGGLLWVVSEAYLRLRHREGMGLGDVKMMLMAGAFLGIKLTILTILVGSLLGAILGSIFILVQRKGSQYELPFGTFLGAGAVLAIFFGMPLVTWYEALLRGPR